jgi:hypothetical protein
MAQITATMHVREMNGAERAYSQHLRDRLLVGEIRWWAYECWKFRLADNTYYTPDFIVVTNDLRIEAHEVKAYWKTAGKVGWTDDARVKIKVAAEHNPVRFVAVTLMPDQQWHVEHFGGAEEVAAEVMLSREQELRVIADALQIPQGAVSVNRIVRVIAELTAAARVGT